MRTKVAEISELVVLELSNILAGPSVGMFFAELGARVIKVENTNTDGDATRKWKTPTEDPDTDISTYFSAANWGKESLGIDLRAEGALDVVHDLARKADIVLLSYKPGDEKKLGLDYDTLRALNPRIIFAQITAYGGDDPRVGFDAIIQAESGFTYLNGEPDSPPTKMPVALVDLLLAHQLKEAILLALLKRERTGEGSQVTVSLLKAATASLANQAANWLVAGVIPERMGSEHPNIVPYGTIFKASDGREIVVAAATERQYNYLLEVLDLNHLREDRRFLTNQDRVKNRWELIPLLAERMEKRTCREIVAAFSEKHIPFGFVNNMKEVFEQKASADLVVEERLPDGTTLRGIHTVAIEGSLFEEEEGLAPPPNFNQHRDAILADFLGYTPEQIDALKQSGATV